MSSRDRETFDLNLNRVGRSVRESGLLAAGAFAVCVALAAFASTKVTPTYTADSQLLFTKVDRTSVLTGFGATGADPGQLQSLLNDQTPLSTQMEILQSRPLLQQTIDILELKDDEGKPLSPEILSANLELSIIGGTDIIEVLYTDTDPQVAAAVVNTLVNQYRENSIDSNRAEAREAKEFLLAQLPQTEAVVRQAEADLRNFLERNQIGVLDEEASALVTRLEGLSGEIATVQSTLEGTAKQVQSLQGKLNLNAQEALTVGTLSQNPGVQEAILALQAVERDLATQEARFSPASPVVRQLRAQQESLQAFLQEEIRLAGGSPNVPDSFIQGTPGQQNITQTLIQDFLDAEVEYTSLQQQLTVLKAYEREYQNRLTAVPSLSAEQRALERRVAVAENTYSALLTRLQELQVQENETTYNTRVIQPAAAPLEPDSGAKLRILALGVFAGALVALAIIIASQIFSAPIKRPRELDPEETSSKASQLL